MAAAGPSTRASSAAAAAALSRRRRRGRCDEMAAARSGTAGASGSALLVLPPSLLRPPPRPEESRCAARPETPGEAAAPPSGPVRCRGCRARPGCARRRARYDGRAPADAPGERCRLRRAGGAAAAGPEPEPGAASPLPRGAPRPAWGRRRVPDAPERGSRARACRSRGAARASRALQFIFRAPITLSKPGGRREEYGSLRKQREEKLQEEKTSDDPIHKLLPEDAETGKRKMEEQKKREEPLILKTDLEHCPARLSDSENEEPSRGKRTQTHRSAFVPKNNSYSLAFLAGNLNARVERSQSCSTAQDRAESRLRDAPAKKAKGASLTSASTPIIGVLLSTQNSRCLSAPDLALEKRLPFSSLSSVASLHKPERSISPESNDSISEELNHFKPIVCSPCTPPKRLPDGRVLSPLIVKSTPRNLSRSLQKQTSYEASPRILRKWEQLLQERQIKKTLSKATLTSLAAEPPGDDCLGSDPAYSSKEKPLLALQARLAGRQALPECAPGTAELEHRPRASQGKAAPAGGQGGSETPAETRTAGASGTTPEPGPGAIPDAKFGKTGISSARKILAISSGPPQTSVLDGVPKAKRQPKPAHSFDLPNGVRSAGRAEEPPGPRRGRKRRCKTKHLERGGSRKRPRGQRPGPSPQRSEQRLQQEAQDRRLALQLQRLFDSEGRTASRRKASLDQYLLRSSVAGAK